MSTNKKGSLTETKMRTKGMGESIDHSDQDLHRLATKHNLQRLHSPKSLVSALSVEVSRLLEHFQWLSEEQSRNLPKLTKNAVATECTDVMLCLMQLCATLQIDPIVAAQKKMRGVPKQFTGNKSKIPSKK